MKARYNPYVQKLIDDEDLRENVVEAYEAPRCVRSRLNGKSPTKQIFDDKKLQKQIREARSIRDAAVALREAPEEAALRRFRPDPARRHRRRRLSRSRSPRACARRCSTRCSAPRRSSSTPRRPRARRRRTPRPELRGDEQHGRDHPRRLIRAGHAVGASRAPTGALRRSRRARGSKYRPRRPPRRSPRPPRAGDALGGRGVRRLLLRDLGLRRARGRAPLAQANSSASIASPAGIRTKAGPGVTSITMPASRTREPATPKATR